jgi:hypothetical protein
VFHVKPHRVSGTIISEDLPNATQYNNVKAKIESSYPVPVSTTSDSIKYGQEGGFIPPEDIAEYKFHL